MWFTAENGVIGQINASGEVVEHSSEPEALNPLRAAPQPDGIALGPDGALWYTIPNESRIGRITPSGAVELFTVPDRDPVYITGTPQPQSIAAGPEGRYMYFTDPSDNSIGRVSLSGEVTEYAIPSTGPVQPGPIVAVGNQLIFTEGAAAVLGVVNPATSPGEAPLATPPAYQQLTASVQEQLAAATATARSPLTRAMSSFSVAFTALEAGAMSLSWTVQPPSPAPSKRTRKKGKGLVHRSTAASPVTIATGQVTVGLAEPTTVHVAVSATWAKLLKRYARHRASLKLTAHATFSGYWAGPVSAAAAQPLTR